MKPVPDDTASRYSGSRVTVIRDRTGVFLDGEESWRADQYYLSEIFSHSAPTCFGHLYTVYPTRIRIQKERREGEDEKNLFTFTQRRSRQGAKFFLVTRIVETAYEL